ncbi:MAG: SCP2 sterol-binding domain-containing protein [Myxococcaceae bacterium]
MPQFPSRDWVEQVLKLLDQDPDRADAAEGWAGDFGVIVDAEPGLLDKSFVVHLEPEKGRLKRFTVLDDPDDLEELEPAYFARAKYSAWKGLLQGTTNPLQLLLRRELTVRGDLQQVAERARFKGMAERVLSQIQTTFAGD